MGDDAKSRAVCGLGGGGTRATQSAPAAHAQAPTTVRLNVFDCGLR